MKKMTEEALSTAFAGESMAHMKYLAFADVAEKEGYPNLARLFTAIAYAERVHATNHARNLGYLKKTLENLRTGFEGETFEIDEMYPAYAAIAELQGEKGAQLAIHYAVEAEKIHAAMYQEAAEKIEQGEDIEEEDTWICPVCGHTHRGKEAPDRCPVCNVKKERYKKF
jgi:rubrerythrin